MGLSPIISSNTGVGDISLQSLREQQIQNGEYYLEELFLDPIYFTHYQQSNGEFNFITPSTGQANIKSLGSYRLRINSAAQGSYASRRTGGRRITPGYFDIDVYMDFTCVTTQTITPDEEILTLLGGLHFNNLFTSDTAGVQILYDRFGIGIRTVNAGNVTIHRPATPYFLPIRNVNAGASGLDLPNRLKMTIRKDEDFASLYVDDNFVMTTSNVNFPQLYNSSRSMCPYIIGYAATTVNDISLFYQIQRYALHVNN